MLARVKAATTEQARTLITPTAATSTYVLRALNDLARQGLADSARIGRSGHKAWYLTRSGASALNAAGLTPKAGRRVRPLAPATAGNGLIHHALAVTQVIADLTPAGATLADWDVEAVHRWLPGSDQGRLIADAALQRSFDMDELVPPVLLVEVDRNTLPVRKLAAELLAYLEFATTSVPEPYKRRSRMPAYQRLYPYAKRCPPILLVLANGTPAQLQRRAKAVTEAVAEDVWEALDIGIVQASELTEAGPSAAIVTRVYAPERPVPLARLPRTSQQFAAISSRKYRIEHLRNQVERIASNLQTFRSLPDPRGEWGESNARTIGKLERELRETQQKLREAEAVPEIPW
jgi:hypothetical protein